MFSEEDGISINETKKIPNFVTFKGLYEKWAFLKTAAQAFEAGDFLNISLRFWWFLRLIFVKKNFW